LVGKREVESRFAPEAAGLCPSGCAQGRLRPPAEDGRLHIDLLGFEKSPHSSIAL